MSAGPSPLRIAVGSDHGGFELKAALKAHVASLGHHVEDLGTHGKEAVDYPKFAQAVARAVASSRARFGIVVDGAGIGSAMAANKVRGVLAATCNTEALAKNAREHNDANVMTLGAKLVDAPKALALVNLFGSSRCVEDRHRRRVAKITALERS